MHWTANHKVICEINISHLMSFNVGLFPSSLFAALRESSFSQYWSGSLYLSLSGPIYHPPNILAMFSLMLIFRCGISQRREVLVLTEQYQEPLLNIFYYIWIPWLTVWMTPGNLTLIHNTEYCTLYVCKTIYIQDYLSLCQHKHV